MTIKELVVKSHALAKDKGFWENKNIPEKLMLCVTELGEACEALRKNKTQTNFTSKAPQEIILNNEWLKDTFEDEIADTFIRLADLCGALNIDIEWQLKKKIEYNKSRPHKHGKEF
jgi:NTP pyrophosphatase (non-canonical NTP hydrolase)